MVRITSHIFLRVQAILLVCISSAAPKVSWHETERRTLFDHRLLLNHRRFPFRQIAESRVLSRGALVLGEPTTSSKILNMCHVETEDTSKICCVHSVQVQAAGHLALACSPVSLFCVL
ncbi:hypothetical protein B0T17DRAFT_394348 [Bombardia bombarda]|uniref:Secreted protein n=1 Tax=Bombardia bombarda TaxID=252184 RepID=A0AA39WCK9_9PEZI|nr:hypothetical protein B0T17DRAFT_394348 [Bombardia bombarda]